MTSILVLNEILQAVIVYCRINGNLSTWACHVGMFNACLKCGVQSSHTDLSKHQSSEAGRTWHFPGSNVFSASPPSRYKYNKKILCFSDTNVVSERKQHV